MGTKQIHAANAATNNEVKELRDAIEVMDGLSQEAFSEISAIADLALKSLEIPEGYRSFDNIANALRAIWSKALDIQNCINVEAENVGCNHVSEADQRRSVALRAARELGLAA